MPAPAVNLTGPRRLGSHPPGGDLSFYAVVFAPGALADRGSRRQRLCWAHSKANDCGLTIAGPGASSGPCLRWGESRRSLLKPPVHALPQCPESGRKLKACRDVPCVDGSGLARKIFTSRCWSVQPCVRPVSAAHGPLAIMPSADQVPVKSPHSRCTGTCGLS